MLISRVVIGRNARQISRLWQALATKFPSLNVDLSLAIRGRPGAKPFVLNLVYLHVDEISFSYESMVQRLAV